MCPLGGDKVGNALRLGRLNEPKTAANLSQFMAQSQSSYSSLRFNYFSGVFNVGLVTRRSPCDAQKETLDRDFDLFAASVDGIVLFLTNHS